MVVRRLLGMAAVVKKVGCDRPTGRTSLELAEGTYEVAHWFLFGEGRSNGAV